MAAAGNNNHGHEEDTGFVPRRFVLAEFASGEALVAGTRKVREAGHKNLDTHTPYPMHGLDEALGLGRPVGDVDGEVDLVHEVHHPVGQTDPGDAGQQDQGGDLDPLDA